MSGLQTLQIEIPFGETYGISEEAMQVFISHFEAAKAEVPDVKIPVFFGMSKEKFVRIFTGEETMEENIDHLWGGISDVVKKDGTADCEVVIQFMDDYGDAVLHAIEEPHHSIQLFPVILEVPENQIDFAALLLRIT